MKRQVQSKKPTPERTSKELIREEQTSKGIPTYNERQEKGHGVRDIIVVPPPPKKDQK